MASWLLFGFVEDATFAAKNVVMENNSWIGLGTAFLCLAFVFFTQNQKDDSLEILKTETMRIHDEAMKDMADMNRVGRALKKELGSLDSLAPRRDVIRQVLGQMKKAEEDMYDWMRNYTPPENEPVEKAKRYLENQKQKIEQNQRDMKAALEAGRSLQRH